MVQKPIVGQTYWSHQCSDANAESGNNDSVKPFQAIYNEEERGGGRAKFLIPLLRDGSIPSKINSDVTRHLFVMSDGSVPHMYWTRREAQQSFVAVKLLEMKGELYALTKTIEMLEEIGQELENPA